MAGQNEPREFPCAEGYHQAAAHLDTVFERDR